MRAGWQIFPSNDTFKRAPWQRREETPRRQWLPTALGWSLALAAVLGSTSCAGLSEAKGRRAAQCDALCDQAQSALRNGEPQRARKLLSEAKRRRAADPETRQHLAESLWMSGRHQDAVAELERLQHQWPTDLGIKLRRAELLLKMGRLDEARQLAQQALIQDADSIPALRLKATIAEQSHDDQDVLATYHQLLRYAPQDRQALERLAQFHRQHGHPEQAAPLLRQLVSEIPAKTPEQAEIRWQLGVVYAQLERWADAALSLRQAARQRSLGEADQALLAEVCDRAGLGTEAKGGAVRQAAGINRDEGGSQRPRDTIWPEEDASSEPDSPGVTPAGYRSEETPGPRR